MGREVMKQQGRKLENGTPTNFLIQHFTFHYAWKWRKEGRVATKVKS